MTPNVIIHDVDRDGWGSAALLVATLGPDVCNLQPTKTKHVVPLINDSDPDAHVRVLDIPAPRLWASLQEREAPLTWVDHHMSSWSSSPPLWIRTVLPKDNGPTTTMSLLLRHGLVEVEGGRDFVRRLCSVDDDPWGLTFDGLSQMFPELPVGVAELPGLLVDGPSGGEVPAALQPAIDHARRQRDVVEEVLAKADTTIDSGLVIARLHDAKSVPLARYSLTLGRRYPGCLVVIIHRRQRLYCGRSSQRAGINLIEHFRERGLDPKGHPYVCTVDVRDDDIEDEVAAIKVTMGGAG